MSRRFSAIHQFHSGASPGDAITNQMFVLQRELRAMGYQSEIFAEHFDGELENALHHIDSLKPSDNELLLVHHSMGHRRLDQILSTNSPLVTVYHNITPAQELDDVGFKHFSHVGRHQLDVLAKQSLMGIAVSHYNRKEMLLRGFTDVEVIPVRTDFREFQSARETRHQERDWLFVGRIAPNKQQLEILRAFNHFHHNVDKTARLFLVGSHSMRNYVNALGDEIEKLGLISHVDAPGKLEDADLVHRYARAGVFVSLSTHEGFGVPLLEAMAAGVPVVALKSSAVIETMGGAGVLLDSSEPSVVSSAVERLMGNPDYLHEVLHKQDLRLKRLTNFNVRTALERVLRKLEGQSFPLRVQIQGPIETSYSLATLNRETALQLSADNTIDVSVYTTEGPGDYAPNEELLSADQELLTLYERGLEIPYPDVIIRQMFPPRVNDTTAPTTLQYFGWEESLIPTEYVNDFNEHVQRIVTMSSFVKQSLINSGVTIPIDVVGVGVRKPSYTDNCQIQELFDLKRVRFLHISSAFPRKGVDVLLHSYFDEFTGDDDVTLILKTFPNPHNATEDILRSLHKQYANPPHVVWINRDIPTEEMGNLYKEATAYVHPSRGEGFGLPVAEAMLAEIPVISTSTTGLADFVDESVATVIPSQSVPANSHVSFPGSEWFEPDASILSKHLRSLYENTDNDLRQQRIKNAASRISEHFSWLAVGNRIRKSIDSSRVQPTSIKVAHITTFNSRCGIAEYSALLQSGLPKYVQSTVIADKNVWPLDLHVEEDVVRLWDQLRHQDLSKLVTALQLSNVDLVHIQYNYGFFSMEDLSELIEQVRNSKPIVITLHRTKDLDRGHEIVSLAHAAHALRKVSAIIVHEKHDVERLAKFGISANVVHIPHATMPFRGKTSDREFSADAPLKIGTFGFLLPHKGLEVTLQALHSLNQRGIPASLKALCSLHPDPSSLATYDRVREIINGQELEPFVTLDTEYRTVEEIHTELSDVDVLVLPYTQTAESSSGVLAMLLGVGKPIIATEIDIFSGARDVLHTIPAPATSQDVVSALEMLQTNPSHMEALGQLARQRSIELSWGAIGRQTSELYRTILHR